MRGRTHMSELSVLQDHDRIIARPPVDSADVDVLPVPVWKTAPV